MQRRHPFARRDFLLVAAAVFLGAAAIATFATPAPAVTARNAADEKPGLGPDAAAPRPIEDEDKPPMKEGPMKDVPSMKQPAREESIYGGKRT